MSTSSNSEVSPVGMSTTKSTTAPKAPLSVRAAASITAASTSAKATVENLRVTAAHYASHPYAVRSAGIATVVADAMRSLLLYSNTVRLAAARGWDPLVVVFGSFLAFTLLVPYDILGIAFPVTNCIGLARPFFYTLQMFQEGIVARKTLFVYLVMSMIIVTLVQTIESFPFRLFLDKIPHYLYGKILFYSWVSHPGLLGANQIYEAIFYFSNDVPEDAEPPISPDTANGLNSPSALDLKPLPLAPIQPPLAPVGNIAESLSFSKIPTLRKPSN